MTHHSDDERNGGRFTFAAFLFMGTIWFAASSTTAGEVHLVGVIGLGVSVALGGVMGMMVGFYNLGRERGR